MRVVPGVLIILLAPLLAAPARADDAPVTLTADQEFRGALPFERRPYRSFSIDVPVGAKRLEVIVNGAADVDLYLRAGAPIVASWKEEADASADSKQKRETLVLTPDGTPALAGGTYFLDVVHGDREAVTPLEFTIVARVTTIGPGQGARAMPPRVEAETFPEGEGAAPLVPDEDEPLVTAFDADFKGPLLLDDAHPYRTFVMEVASDVSSVELRLEGTKGDCDIFVRWDRPMISWEDADARGNGPDGNELVTLRRDAAPRLRSGTYYIDVARASEEPMTVTFSATFTRGFDGPEVTGSEPVPSEEDGVQGEIHEDALFTTEFPADEPDFRTWVVLVPKGTRSLLVTTSGSDKDVDVYLRHARPIENYRSDPDHRANTARHHEQLYIDASSTPPLRAGKYYLDVTRAVAEDPVVPFEVSVRFNADRPAPIPATPGPVQAIAFGERVTVALERNERKAARFSFQVPTGAQRLHVAILGATRDIDLFMRHGEVITDYDDATGYDWKAVSSRLNERLLLDARSNPPLDSGTYYLDVASLVTADAHIRFTLLVTVGEPPALGAEDMRLPPFVRQAPLSPLEQVLQATVQIEGEHGAGSGTCVSPGGLIVTNHHVLEHEGKLQAEDIFVSFPNLWDEPPEQVFVARVLAHDADLDLVLLQIEEDIFDRKLPATIALPWVPVGDASAVHLGDVLVIAGYPAVGGDESRSSISVTRGIISGFNTDGRRRTWIKTDATINSGNSGGSAYWQDEKGAYHYVGVPTQKLYEDGGALGYCRPTTCLPAEFVEKLAAAHKR